MEAEHTTLRSAIDSLEESSRLLSRYNKRDMNFKFTIEDVHTLRAAANMAFQGVKSIAECSGYVECLTNLHTLLRINKE